MKINFKRYLQIELQFQELTMVMKIPNSLFKFTESPSVKTNCCFFSFFAFKTVATCWAATDKTGNSMRLNSSKQPQVPDWASPESWEEKFFSIFFRKTAMNFYPSTREIVYNLCKCVPVLCNPFGLNNWTQLHTFLTFYPCLWQFQFFLCQQVHKETRPCSWLKLEPK